MKLRHFFLPHPQTHKKAHLLSTQALLIYLVFFLVLNFTFSNLARYKPGVLGVSSSSNIDQKELIRLTNIERQKAGLGEVTEDSRLDAAAAAKARNMFEENYWAHYSPTNKTPWDFIQGSGYKFTYAGENLARNFYTSNEVVKAWMASPTHKDNIVNSHYTHIGMAVVEGVLNGQKTILVVQEFGRPMQGLAEAPVSDDSNQKIAQTPTQLASEAPSAPQPTVLIANANIQKTAGESAIHQFTLDPFLVTKVAGMSLVTFLALLIALDLYIIRRRMVHRIATRHLPQMAIMSVAASTLWNSSAGNITTSAVSFVLGGTP